MHNISCSYIALNHSCKAKSQVHRQYMPVLHNQSANEWKISGPNGQIVKPEAQGAKIQALPLPTDVFPMVPEAEG